MDKLRLPLWILQTVVEKFSSSSTDNPLELTTPGGNTAVFTKTTVVGFEGKPIEVIDIEINPGD